MNQKSSSEIRKMPQGVFLIYNNQVISIDSPTINIGRNLKNDVVISNDAISREHAQIFFERGDFTLYDLQSTSGTFVNNKKVDRCKLNSGDIISLADQRIMFVDNSSRLKEKTLEQTKSLNLRNDSSE
jgi:pSer/pThr/pTyr-binding forkhead associated (FHA) protein